MSIPVNSCSLNVFSFVKWSAVCALFLNMWVQFSVKHVSILFLAFCVIAASLFKNDQCVCFW